MKICSRKAIGTSSVLSIFVQFKYSAIIGLICSSRSKIGELSAHFKMLSRTRSGISKLTNLTPAALNVAVRGKHTLPDLSFDYEALEPTINTEIMRLHHSKHHATYVNNLNVAEEKYAEAIATGKYINRN